MPASSLSVAAPSGSALASRRQALQSRYRRVRGFSEAIAEPLEPEDCVLQSMPAASPIRWHLAHTTWFFSQFLLQAHADYRSPFPQAEALFNSYYNTVGEPFPQARRGLLSRPTVAEVGDYRKAIDQAVLEYLEAAPTAAALDVLEIGLHHEQQHQERLFLQPLSARFDVRWSGRDNRPGAAAVGGVCGRIARDRASPGRLRVR